MMAKSHLVLGLAAWVAAAPMLHLPPYDPLCLACAAVGALLPDVDHPKSAVGQRVWPVSAAIASVLGHRGITHSAAAVAVLVLALAQTGWHRATVAALAVGYGSHLAADMLTPQGLRLWWPLKRTWGLPLCRTGSVAEALVVGLLCGAAGWMAHARL